MILKPDFLKASLLSVVVAVPLLLSGSTLPQEAKPITKDQLISALRQLRRGDSQTVVVTQVRTRGVDFKLTPAIEAQLRRAGALRTLLGSVRNGFRRQAIAVLTPTPTPTPADRLNADGMMALVYWGAIRDSKNPEDFYNYLNKYPDSTNYGNAKDHLAKLSLIRVQAGIDLVWIHPGSFMMGSEKGDLDEQPLHQVTISKGFYLGKYEVTQMQWQKVMGDNPSKFTGDDLPVEQVSWALANDFIAKLNAQDDGYTYMLPSEAQWEYAARAGTVGEYAGDLDAMAWYDKNSEQHTQPVGTKQRNALGLFDMFGNVFEWCEDWYHETYEGAPADGSAWLTDSDKRHRVLRGGSWGNSAAFCRSTDRVKVDYLHHHDTGVGLRVLAILGK